MERILEQYIRLPQINKILRKAFKSQKPISNTTIKNKCFSCGRCLLWSKTHSNSLESTPQIGSEQITQTVFAYMLCFRIFSFAQWFLVFTLWWWRKLWCIYFFKHYHIYSFCTISNTAGFDHQSSDNANGGIWLHYEFCQINEWTIINLDGQGILCHFPL